MKKVLHVHKKDYSWNPSAWTCENNKYLKGIAGTSVIALGNNQACDWSFFKKRENIILWKILDFYLFKTLETALLRQNYQKRFL